MFRFPRLSGGFPATNAKAEKLFKYVDCNKKKVNWLTCSVCFLTIFITCTHCCLFMVKHWLRAEHAGWHIGERHTHAHVTPSKCANGYTKYRNIIIQFPSAKLMAPREENTKRTMRTSVVGCYHLVELWRRTITSASTRLCSEERYKAFCFPGKLVCASTKYHPLVIM